jgi:hypothetical protein
MSNENYAPAATQIPPLHELSMIAQVSPGSDTFKVHCFCGETWTINRKEKDAGETKMEWHKKYADRAKTRVD